MYRRVIYSRATYIKTIDISNRLVYAHIGIIVRRARDAFNITIRIILVEYNMSLYV